MGKTLVIAEKPSVGRDLTRALPSAFAKHEGYLESDSHVVTWAVGHLVQLAEPDEYDARFKKWRMADLPIVPDRFKLVGRDERSRKQVKRLWLQSMTQQAIEAAFGALIPAEGKAKLEEAARSRSEADWIVGMNATRAATIRLRSAFDGAVSLGRVQTPTLAIIARREITKLEKTKRTEKPPLLYDLTSLQRDANTRFGFSARRTLAAAQRLYEEHKALTYPRTSSRFLPSDMGGEIKPIAELVGTQPEYRRAAAYVRGLDVLPTARVINDAKVTDHHAIIPTRSSHRLEKMSDDDRRIYDMVARRFLATFHPEAVFENTRLETTVAEHVFRTRGRVLLVPGWRGVYGEGLEEKSADDDDGPDQ